MAILYYPKGQILARRDASNPSYEQLTLANWPDMVLYFDTSSAVNAASASTLYITSSWALTASVSVVFQSVTSASFASSSLTSSVLVSGTIITASAITSNTYQLSSSYSNLYTSSFILSNIDDGKLIVMTSGSASVCTIPSTVSATFNALFYQSGSGTFILTGSAGAILRNRSNKTSSAGQYAMVSLVRVPNGDFVVGGDTA